MSEMKLGVSCSASSPPFAKMRAGVGQTTEESEVQSTQALPLCPTTIVWFSPEEGPNPEPGTGIRVPPVPGPFSASLDPFLKSTTGRTNRADGPPRLKTSQRITATSTESPLPESATQDMAVSEVQVLCRHAVRPRITTSSAAGDFPKFCPETFSIDPPRVLRLPAVTFVTIGAS